MRVALPFDRNIVHISLRYKIFKIFLDIPYFEFYLLSTSLYFK